MGTIKCSRIWDHTILDPITALTRILVDKNAMFHGVSGTGESGSGEMHKGDVWKPPENLGKFWGEGGTSEL